MFCNLKTCLTKHRNASKDPKVSATIIQKQEEKGGSQTPETATPIIKVVAPHVQPGDLSAATASVNEKNIKEQSLENAKPAAKATITTKIKEKLIGLDKKIEPKEPTGRTEC